MNKEIGSEFAIRATNNTSPCWERHGKVYLMTLLILSSIMAELNLYKGAV